MVSRQLLSTTDPLPDLDGNIGEDVPPFAVPAVAPLLPSMVHKRRNGMRYSAHNRAEWNSANAAQEKNLAGRILHRQQITLARETVLLDRSVGELRAQPVAAHL